MEEVTWGRSWFEGGAGQWLQGQVCSPADHPAGDVHQAGVVLRRSDGSRWSFGAASRQVALALDEGPEKSERERRGHRVNAGTTDA